MRSFFNFPSGKENWMRIRKADIKDASAIAKVHVESWRTTYNGLFPNSYLESLTPESREKKWEEILSIAKVFVAETDAGEVVGFANGGNERTGNYPDFSGELYVIYLLESYQKIGLGKQLVQEVTNDLISKNFHSMTVIVLEDNQSRYFYEALGARMIDQLKTEIEGIEFTELVYGWENLSELNNRLSKSTELNLKN